MPHTDGKDKGKGRRQTPGSPGNASLPIGCLSHAAQESGVPGGYCQDLSRSARLWKLRDMEWVRALKRNRRPSGVRVKTRSVGPTCRARRGDDVQMVVVPVVLQLIEHPLLVAAPGLAKSNVRGEGIHSSSAMHKIPIGTKRGNLEQDDGHEDHLKTEFARLVPEQSLAEQGPGTSAGQSRCVQYELRDAGPADDGLSFVIPVEQQSDHVYAGQIGNRWG